MVRAKKTVRGEVIKAGIEGIGLANDMAGKVLGASRIVRHLSTAADLASNLMRRRANRLKRNVIKAVSPARSRKQASRKRRK